MNNIFISNIEISKVRHLSDISIPLSEEKIKHMIFTGKNGSGKTSVLEAISCYLNAVATLDRIESKKERLHFYQDKVSELEKKNDTSTEIIEATKHLNLYQSQLKAINGGVDIAFNMPIKEIRCFYEKGQFIMAYYKAERIFEAEKPKHVEKIELKEKYSIDESPRKVFVKYLLDLRVTEALARTNGKNEKADEIKAWFVEFEKLLQDIFDDKTMTLVFKEEDFSFWIKAKDREPFDFNTLSSGFAAVLDIIVDIIVRMERKTEKAFDFNLPGIVLIDEIETHLHIDLQKTILKLLTKIFPNIQFIVSTHSPFILNSLDNAVIYDLEKNVLVEDGLTNIPYAGIVEGYFDVSTLSTSLEEKFERYKNIVKKDVITDEDIDEITKLEMYLDEIPDYLALEFTTKYQELKQQFECRGDL